MIYQYIKHKQGDITLVETSILNSFRWSLEASVESYKLQVKWLMEYNPNGLTGPDLRIWAGKIAETLLPRIGTLEEIETLIKELKSDA